MRLKNLEQVFHVAYFCLNWYAIIVDAIFLLIMTTGSGNVHVNKTYVYGILKF